MSENLMERIANWLEDYYPKHNTTDSGWLIDPEVAKERYRQDASQCLSFLKSQIEQMAFTRVDIEGKPEVGRFYDGYLACKEDILRELE